MQIKKGFGRSLLALVAVSVLFITLSCFTLLIIPYYGVSNGRSKSLVPDSAVLLLMLLNATSPPLPSTLDLRNHTSTLLIQHLPLHSNFSLTPSSSAAASPIIHAKPKTATSISRTSARAASHGSRIGPRCTAENAKLKVYMYDLPPSFHFGLISWKPSRSNQTWPNVVNPAKVPRYPGGLNMQHSAEYWLVLDLLASESSSSPRLRNRPCYAVRVQDYKTSDVVLVPFFSSLSYNRYSSGGRDRKMQEELVKFLLGRKEWRRKGGKDHVVLAHHPNSMLYARKKLRNAMFLLADFGRYPSNIANVNKDVIAPYKHVVRSINASDSLPYNRRPTLAFFQGAISRKAGGVIRKKLNKVLRNAEEVKFGPGTAQNRGGTTTAGKGMATSKYCFHVAGDTPSSNRLFDAIASRCIPVVVSDDIELPFEDVVDYDGFCVFIHSFDAVRKGFLVRLLTGIGKEEWTRMLRRLGNASKHFEYRFPSIERDAVQMIWEAIDRKRRCLASSQSVSSFPNNCSSSRNRDRRRMFLRLPAA